MKDYQASLEKLRRDAAEAALVRDLDFVRPVADPTEPKKQKNGTI
jgi:hypothetical protein